jgi:hypothetical protein
MSEPITIVTYDPDVEFYVDHPDEYEWLKAETKAIIEVCREKRILPYSVVNFRYQPTRRIPWNKPTEQKDEIQWFLDWNKQYNKSLVGCLRREHSLEEKEKRVREKFLAEAKWEFWNGLSIFQKDLYRQINSPTASPEILHEGERLETDFVRVYTEEHRNMFAPLYTEAGAYRSEIVFPPR